MSSLSNGFVWSVPGLSVRTRRNVVRVSMNQEHFQGSRDLGCAVEIGNLGGGGRMVLGRLQPPEDTVDTTLTLLAYYICRKLVAT
jgi:hypothetical protein